jgi:hypothetical protein
MTIIQIVDRGSVRDSVCEPLSERPGGDETDLPGGAQRRAEMEAAAAVLESGAIGVRHPLRQVIHDGERMSNHFVARMPGRCRPSRSFRSLREQTTSLTETTGQAMVHYDGCHESRSDVLILEARPTHRVPDTTFHIGKGCPISRGAGQDKLRHGP